MRIRIKITNDLYFFFTGSFALCNFLIAVFNRIISNIEKIVLVSLGLILGYYFYKIKMMIDTHKSGDVLTIPRIQRLIIDILLIISLFMIIFYGESTNFDIF